MEHGGQAIDAGTFTFVMATGIVSVAASLESLPVVSAVLFVVATVAWVALAVGLAAAALAERRRRPNLQSFALVAGIVVVGDRLLLYGSPTLALGLLALAVVSWVGLLARRPVPEEPTGGSLLAVVAVEALAALAAALAPRDRGALLVAALACWLLGLLLYPLLVTAIARSQWRRPRFVPDLWVLMGALAIATLAGSEILLAARGLDRLGTFQPWLRGVDLATWAIASAWIVPLVVLELRAPNAWASVRPRWSFVFPLGMYSVATWTLGRAVGLAPLADIARVSCFVAIAAWAVVLLLRPIRWVLGRRAPVPTR